MVRTFSNVNEAFEYIVHQLADIRGEAFASRVLAGLALDVLLANASDKRAAFDDFEQKAFTSVESLKPDSSGEPGLFEEQKTVARMRIEQTLEELRRIHGLRSDPSH